MALAAKTVVLRNHGSNPSQVTCTIKPCKDELHEDLQQLLSAGVLDAFGSWSFPAPPPGSPFAPPNPLVLLHVLSRETGPDVRVVEWQGEDVNKGDQAGTAQAKAAFAQWHKSDLDLGRCVVFRFPTADMELVLVPARVKTGGGKSPPGPVYWGYTVPANLLPLVAGVIHRAKLVVVFDIDETLLMAHTVDSLQTRLSRCKAERKAKAAELDKLMADKADLDAMQQMEAELAAMELERELLQKDFDMLNSFRMDAACRVQLQGPAGVPAQVYEPTWETVNMASGGTATRPVVRLELGGRPVYITRIQPHLRNTSMLIRPRPGWEQLRAYIAGQSDFEATGIKKERWEVYLCTTADREYAWEAWRLLDPKASLFPLAQLSWRMLCVAHPQKKDLLNVLRKQDIDAAAAAGWPVRCPSDAQLITDKMRATRPRVGGPVPLCIVVDDRLDVWEEDSRKAVLQVLPFHPHKEAGTLDLGRDSAPRQQYQQACDSEQELRRVMFTIRDVRSLFYQHLDQFVKPEAKRVTEQGVSEQMQSCAASILTHLLIPFKSVPQLLAESPHQPPAALGSTDKDDRASDLRLLVHDGTMEPAAANGNGSGAQQQQQQQPLGVANGPADPRKRRLATAMAAAGDQQAADQVCAAPNKQEQGGAQPPAKKQKKEKKKGAFGDIMNSLQRQHSEQQVKPEGQPQHVTDDAQQPNQQQQQQSSAEPATSMAAAAPTPAAGTAASMAGGDSADAKPTLAIAAAAAAAEASAPTVASANTAAASRSLTASAAAVPAVAGGVGNGPAAAAAPAAATAAGAKGISGLAAAAAAVTTGASEPGDAAPASAAQQQLQLLLGPLSQAFAAPAPPEHAVQLLTGLVGGAPLESPQSASALLQLLPQALRDMVPAEDMWAVLAAVKLQWDSRAAGAAAADVQVLTQALQQALPSRAHNALQGLVGLLGIDVTQLPAHLQEVAAFLRPVMDRPAAAVQVGQPPAAAGNPSQQQASAPLQQNQQQQQQAVKVDGITPPPSPLPEGAGLHVVDLRAVSAAQKAAQQQQQPTGALGAGSSMQWQPLPTGVQQGPGGQGGQLGFGALGMTGRQGGPLQHGITGPPPPGLQQGMQQSLQGLTLLPGGQQQPQLQQGAQQQQMGFMSSGPPSGPQPGAVQGLQPGPGPASGGVVLQGLGGGPVFLMSTPAGVTLQPGVQQLPPGLMVQGPPPPMHQSGQLGLSGPASGGQQQQQQQVLMGYAGQGLQQLQQQQPPGPMHGRGVGQGFQQQPGQQGPPGHQGPPARGGRSNQHRGGKPWQLQRDQQGQGQRQAQGQGQQQQGHGQGQAQQQGQGEGQGGQQQGRGQGRGGRNQGQGRGGGRGRGRGVDQGRGQHRGRGRGRS